MGTPLVRGHICVRTFRSLFVRAFGHRDGFVSARRLVKHLAREAIRCENVDVPVGIRAEVNGDGRVGGVDCEYALLL